ncbi:MAG TPA: hypothetical protein VGE08_25235 [Steroidobacter sp.]|uniref:hypothetical protein n=1 Tax=Steroidobacter sp. TaxID=1978227 RepID=UPI002EDA1C63
MLYRSLCTVALGLWTTLAFADFDAVPKRPIDLTGYWVLNTANSDDPEAMLTERQAKERERFERWRRREEETRPQGMPPPIDVDAPPPQADDRRRGPRPWQKRYQENLLRMLAVSSTLEIKQPAATRFEFISAVETRRVEAGSHTQVSMPEGQLADSWVGWDGDWFVIERRVRRGPRGLEKFRLTKTGQLEYFMQWSGDSELAGMKIRRFFDRRTGPEPVRNPDHGPLP